MQDRPPGSPAPGSTRIRGRGSRITQHLLERGRAVALLCRRDGQPLELAAGAFVLAAGTYGAPALLLRSGIGPAAGLAALGIPVAVDVPGVGANLHDHPGAALSLAPSAAAAARLDGELAAGRFHQSQVALRARAGRLHLFPYQSQGPDRSWALELYAFVLAPRARGRLRLASPDPAVPPSIDLGLLADAGGRDLAALRRGLRLAQRLAREPALAALCDQPSPAGPLPDAWLHAHVVGYDHPVGTCRMGHRGDPAAVVDADGVVVGTGNVVVADASVIPVLPHAGTNLTAMLLGWCLAERLPQRLAYARHT